MTTRTLLTRFCKDDGDIRVSSGTVVPLRTYCWWVNDILPLKNVFAEIRRATRINPGVQGVLPYRTLRTDREIPLEMTVISDVDRTGTLYTGNRWQSFHDNLDYLDTHVVAPPSSGNGTRTFEIDSPDGLTTMTGDFHVKMTLGETRDLMVGENFIPAIIAKVTLDLFLPAGVLVAV